VTVDTTKQLLEAFGSSCRTVSPSKQLQLLDRLLKVIENQQMSSRDDAQSCETNTSKAATDDDRSCETDTTKVAGLTGESLPTEQMSELPKVSSVKMNASELPEVSSVKRNASKVPEVSSVKMSVSDRPEVSSVKMIVSEVSEVSSVKMIASELPKVSSVKMSASELPEVLSVKMNASDNSSRLSKLAERLLHFNSCMLQSADGDFDDSGERYFDDPSRANISDDTPNGKAVGWSACSDFNVCDKSASFFSTPASDRIDHSVYNKCSVIGMNENPTIYANRAYDIGSLVGESVYSHTGPSNRIAITNETSSTCYPHSISFAQNSSFPDNRRSQNSDLFVSPAVQISHTKLNATSFDYNSSRANTRQETVNDSISSLSSSSYLPTDLNTQRSVNTHPLVMSGSVNINRHVLFEVENVDTCANLESGQPVLGTSSKNSVSKLGVTENLSLQALMPVINDLLPDNCFANIQNILSSLGVATGVRDIRPTQTAADRLSIEMSDTPHDVRLYDGYADHFSDRSEPRTMQYSGSTKFDNPQSMVAGRFGNTGGNTEESAGYNDTFANVNNNPMSRTSQYSHEGRETLRHDAFPEFRRNSRSDFQMLTAPPRPPDNLLSGVSRIGMSTFLKLPPLAPAPAPPPATAPPAPLLVTYHTTFETGTRRIDYSAEECSPVESFSSPLPRPVGDISARASVSTASYHNDEMQESQFLDAQEDCVLKEMKIHLAAIKSKVYRVALQDFTLVDKETRAFGSDDARNDHRDIEFHSVKRSTDTVPMFSAARTEEVASRSSSRLNENALENFRQEIDFKTTGEISDCIIIQDPIKVKSEIYDPSESNNATSTISPSSAVVPTTEDSIGSLLPSNSDTVNWVNKMIKASREIDGFFKRESKIDTNSYKSSSDESSSPSQTDERHSFKQSHHSQTNGQRSDAHTDRRHNDKVVACSDRSVVLSDRSVKHNDRSVTHSDRSVKHSDRSVTHSDRSVTSSDRSVKHSDRSVPHIDRNATHSVRSVAVRDNRSRPYDGRNSDSCKEDSHKVHKDRTDSDAKDSCGKYGFDDARAYSKKDTKGERHQSSYDTRQAGHSSESRDGSSRHARERFSRDKSDDRRRSPDGKRRSPIKIK